MLNHARDLAQASLWLLDKSTLLGNPEKLQLAAALMANHICDWHYRPHEPNDSDKNAFKAKYPEWHQIRQFSNGLKHPIRKGKVQAKNIVQRQAEWEDYDFWDSPLEIETVFIEIDGQERSLYALVQSFCEDYIRDNPA